LHPGRCGIHSIDPVVAIRPVSSVTADAEEEPAIASVATRLTRRRAVAASATISEQEGISAATTVGSIAAISPEQASIAAVTCGAHAIVRRVDAVSEQSEQRPARDRERRN